MYQKNTVTFLVLKVVLKRGRNEIEATSDSKTSLVRGSTDISRSDYKRFKSTLSSGEVTVSPSPNHSASNFPNFTAEEKENIKKAKVNGFSIDNEGFFEVCC